MNALTVLFGGALSETAFQGRLGGPSAGVSGHQSRDKSAFERALSRGAAFPGVQKLCLFITENALPSPLPPLPVPVETVFRPAWDNKTLLDALAAVSAGFDLCYFAWADSPFLDPKLAGAVAERHLRYPADYSYADGYACGLAPEVLSPGTAAILGKLLEKDATLGAAKVTRDSIFLVLQKDINSFDIETEVAPIDHRPYRLSFTADSKRNLLLCRRFFDEGIAQTEDGLLFTERVIKEKPLLLRTLPAFFPVQITGRCPRLPGCAICPFAPLAQKSGAEMEERDFTLLLDKIAAFAGDAVIDLSLWGEPALHSRRGAFIAAVLARPALSLIVETAVFNWDEGEIAVYAEAASRAAPRLNGMAPVSWIVSAPSPSVENPQPESVFQKHFPADSYHQMVRLKGNEDDVERFYRYWKAHDARVIIQKYDRFGGLLPDRSTADLSPVRRHPCWHLMRDFPVLLDGGVPFCREDMAGLSDDGGRLGNALCEPLEAIWERNNAAYREQCDGVYAGLCGTCDEWYTYNF
ncbi:MAG: spiro-SPASM protein [Spirochaetaceae bacterium]|jgi:spiro-SPASM protein|nr:spiro-SPASM protein [Spirochaetaceae bacterium]